ncbi:hypothetical protein ACFP2T_27025 [Plantactinospora solaniradicis]|uniref:Serine protease n=1 Tax=Plantactinospora solaniradicis TaxID=1723736 RepID=A0ABW1KDY3_9ACTN
MESPLPQDPQGPGRAPQGPTPQPDQQAGALYPGYDDVHADHYRRQAQQAAEAAAHPGSGNPFHNLRNWGMPEARPGLDRQEKARYDEARSEVKRKMLRLAGLLALLAVIAILSLIGAIT